MLKQMHTPGPLTMLQPQIQLCILHTLMHCDAYASVEGESFVSMQTLEVDVPKVMGGSVTVTHKITEDSPLFDCVVDGVVTPSKLDSCAFTVTIVAHDDVYQAEVNAMK